MTHGESSTFWRQAERAVAVSIPLSGNYWLWRVARRGAVVEECNQENDELAGPALLMERRSMLAP